MSTRRIGNDLLRKTFILSPRDRIVLTARLAFDPNKDEVLRAVQKFSDFTDDNDPYGEHDFGTVLVQGKAYFWKIDYYDLNYRYGAEPDTEEYARLLTVMLAEEW